MTTTIYVLELADNCWYVGKTNNVQKRIQQHLVGTGSAWTRKHRPLALSATFPNVSHFEEDRMTKEYMAHYGINKVRGGVYVQIELPDEQKRSIQREIYGATDRCFICGSPEQHFAAECTKQTTVFSLFSGNPLSPEDSEGTNGWMGTSATKEPPATKEPSATQPQFIELTEARIASVQPQTPPATQQPQPDYFSFSSLVEFISTIWVVPPSYQEYLDTQRTPATKV